jgi:hypothetical protein
MEPLLKVAVVLWAAQRSKLISEYIPTFGAIPALGTLKVDMFIYVFIYSELDADRS